MSAACSGKKPDSECPMSTAPFSFTASAAMFFHVGLGLGSSRVEIRDHLLVKFVHRLDRKLLVGKRLAVLGAETKYGPGGLMAGARIWEAGWAAAFPPSPR